MFRMSKASIIRSSICTEQVGRYNARVIVGSSYGVVRCVLVMAQRALDMGRRLDLQIQSPTHIHRTLNHN